MNLANLVTEAERLAGRVDSLFSAASGGGSMRRKNSGPGRAALAAAPARRSFTTDGTRTLMLPPRVRTVLWAADQTDQRPLDNMKHWDREFPAAFFGNTSGAAQVVRQMGISAVSRQPAWWARSRSMRCLRTPSPSTSRAWRWTRTPPAARRALHYARETIPIASDGTYTSTTLFPASTRWARTTSPADIQVRDGASNLLARIPRDAYQTQYRQLDPPVHPAGRDADRRAVPHSAGTPGGQCAGSAFLGGPGT